ncbi:uncharacterized protein UMAG_06168 [Mycosarcoma maydis]|uniref:Uncharacterized protein n=1 Tax=Mycosarcoma maydis TaxID=5270 RepID=A0A0D1CFH5_MYCMD|nr:uncharacterized protein UMAG_06168 [Ustilago maydis 521]KIS65788.1 hypothetical protein UMAG_06168 [Ustilago maydis 521]|eukprot:XP_011392544.1 hypothetical protein UMAG_06168 [Ustilago maydis 521]
MGLANSLQDAAGSSAAPYHAVSLHNHGVFLLLNSLLEPNFVILVAYLCINMYLAFRVISIATRRHRQLNLIPRESGGVNLVKLPVTADEDVLKTEPFLQGRARSQKPKSDTPVADALIRLATWAFQNEAQCAKRIFGLLAVFSLASTWYYMLAFLRHSYLSYLERCRLASYPLPPTPPPWDLSRPALLVAALHLRILRISQWLASLSLFKEAWMEVIKDAPSWWWSSEICVITVGAWALFLRHEAERLRIPHVWTVMALGQLVAISFAFNLFNLAVIYRLDVIDLIAARSHRLCSGTHRVMVPLQDNSSPSPPQIWSMSEDERPDEASRVSATLYRPTLRTPNALHATSLPSNPRASPPRNVRVVSTELTVQRFPLAPQPQFMDKLARLMQRCIPEELGMPLFVLAGLSSVLQHPNSFTKVMVMHVFPLLISLYPAYRTSSSSSRLLPSLRVATAPIEPNRSTGQILLEMVSRSKSRLPLWKDAKVYYLALGIVSILLRFWVSLACFLEVNASRTNLHRAWQTVTLLFPTTFGRHPAQSSISSDHVCVALSATVFVLIESGLWLWKTAVASPSCYLPPDGADDENKGEDHDGHVLHGRFPTLIKLDRLDRKVIETQACVVVVLLVLSPLLGGSATFSLYLAVRCMWVEQYQRYRAAQDDTFLRRTQHRGHAVEKVVEDTEEVQLLENEEGERCIEVRRMYISELRPRSISSTRPDLRHGTSGDVVQGRTQTITNRRR